jgi:hypothetical protein
MTPLANPGPGQLNAILAALGRKIHDDPPPWREHENAMLTEYYGLLDREIIAHVFGRGIYDVIRQS